MLMKLMNIRSINANLHKIEKFSCLVKNLPYIVCVCETWLTSLKPFMGCMGIIL